MTTKKVPSISVEESLFLTERLPEEIYYIMALRGDGTQPSLTERFVRLSKESARQACIWMMESPGQHSGFIRRVKREEIEIWRLTLHTDWEEVSREVLDG